MKNNQNINSRPKSSISIHNLPGIINKKKNKYCYPVISNGERQTNFEIEINPKLDAEDIYKKNQELKEVIKELKRKIDFYKTNNQKLSQSISKKNKEIDELTNQIILKNKELMTKEKKQKIVKNQKEQNKSQDLIINKENILEDKLTIKKLKNEVNEVKEEMQRLQLSLFKKEEELFEIKMNKKFTDYQELKIKYETILDEFNKLRNAKLVNSDKNYFLCLQSDKSLRNEIQNLQGVIGVLNQEKDNYLLEKKKMMEEINDLKSKLELANNNNKLIKNKKKLFEDKYKKNIKEQVILKEYEEEKKEMLNKMNKMQKKLDYYMLNAVKNKEYAINKDNNKNKNNQEENKNNIFENSEIRRNIIKVKNVQNPEQNYDTKILLMQSLITELTNENKELLEKTKNYELKINSLLQTNKEILNSNLGLDNLFISNNNNINNNNDNTQKKEKEIEIEKEIKKEKENKEQKNQEENELESISKDDDDEDEN